MFVLLTYLLTILKHILANGGGLKHWWLEELPLKGFGPLPNICLLLLWVRCANNQFDRPSRLVTREGAIHITLKGWGWSGGSVILGGWETGRFVHAL